MNIMNLNYFSIMEAADKEMLHSAMLRFLLHNVPPVRELFAPFSPQGDDLRISLEEKVAAKKVKISARFDVVARSGEGPFEHILIVENKFKSFPATAQLTRYDQILQENAKKFPNPVKYLLCFDAAALTGGGAGEEWAASGKAAPWHIVSYNCIRAALSHWLENAEQDILAETRVLCHHYVTFLEAYYTTFNKICEDYSAAFCTLKEQEKAEQDAERMLAPSAKLLANPAHAPNFWQTLVLHQVGLTLEKRLRGEFGDAACKAAMEGRLIVHSGGASSTPCVNIQPPHWPGGNGKKPSVCIQVQGRDIKLYIDNLKGLKTAGAREKVLGYARKLRELLGDESGVADTMMQSHARRSNSFSVYKSRFLPSGDCKAGIAILADRVWDFYQRADGAIKQAGPFPA